MSSSSFQPRRTALPIVALPAPSVLLPGVILRIFIDDRLDIQALLAKSTYEALKDKGKVNSTILDNEEGRSGKAQFVIGFVPLGLSKSGGSGNDKVEENNNKKLEVSAVNLDPASASPEDLCDVGVIGRIVGFEQGRFPPGRSFAQNGGIGAAILVEGINRFKIENVIAKTPFLEAEISIFLEGSEQVPTPPPQDLITLFTKFKQLSHALLHLLRLSSLTLARPGSVQFSPAPALSRRLEDFIHNRTVYEAGNLVDFFMAAVDPSFEDKLKILKTIELDARLDVGCKVLATRIAEIKRLIEDGEGTISKSTDGIPGTIIVRRRVVPSPEIKGMGWDRRVGHGGPGGSSGLPMDVDQERELEELEKKLVEAKLSPEAQTLAQRELTRLKRLSPIQPEYSVQRTFLETLTEIPWSNFTPDTLYLTQSSIVKARKQLDDDHFGLEKVKKRLIEYIAILRLKLLKQQEEAATSAASPNTPSETFTETPSPQPTPAPAKAPSSLITKPPILLLVGPPGTGKTSLARSIATALGRRFHRISLGGVHNEAEIRGHRRTYIAAMPGVIINGLKKVGVTNPVILLDEIDKVGNRSHNGDPSAALLEVLDPEQNSTFVDHYVSIPVDLSKVIFIATANSLRDIPAPLLDRMETIRLHGYTNLEKIQIAERFLVPKQRALNGLTEKELQIPREVLERVINHYTREPGVRNLEREIGSICRAKAVEWADFWDKEREHARSEESSTFTVTDGNSNSNANTESVNSENAINHPQADTIAAGNEGEQQPLNELNSISSTQVESLEQKYDPVVHLADLEKILGMEKFHFDIAERGTLRPPGIVNGLVAFSNEGGIVIGSGAMMFIEVAVMPGTAGDGLKLTGSLGNVIKESVEVALTWVKSHAYELGLTADRGEDITKNKTIHIHCPAGADPKDGPSAGLAFTIALLSLFSERPVPAHIAMTGEVSLQGRVTAVGAIKEKLIGALAAGIKTAILPDRNKHNVKELPEEVKRGMEIVLVSHVSDVLKIIWPDWSVLGGNNDNTACLRDGIMGPLQSRL